MPKKKQNGILKFETKKSIYVILLSVFIIILSLSLFGKAGVVGELLNTVVIYVFGWTRYILPVIFIIITVMMARKDIEETWLTYLGILFFFVSLNGILHMLLSVENRLISIPLGKGGGYIGWAVSMALEKLTGFWASVIILAALLVLSLVLFFNAPLSNIFGNFWVFRFFQNSDKKSSFKTKDLYEDIDGDMYKNEGGDEEETQEEEDKDSDSNEEVAVENEVAEEAVEDKNIKKEENFLSIPFHQVKWKTEDYILPLKLLDNTQSKPKGADIKLGQARIKRTLENFGIEVEMGEVKVGPTITQYTLKPAEGVKLSRITALSDNLALALAAHPIRIEAPIPGKPLVGIEVPNRQIATVRLREIIESKDFQGSAAKNKLTIALGKDVSGKCWVDDLSGMPHLLVAGATGSGKSVCLNTIIMSLLFQNSPNDLRLILVDPKRVELPVYNGIPHLLTPVITDVKKTVNALKWVIGEMDRRFDVLSQSGKRNINSYNNGNEEKMPYLIIIIDELADLMVSAAAEIEACVIRLTQMARAVGIHLVIATQRPSVDVITGLIKANVPARIAFNVASLMDSRTILDCSGAEKLVGKGDMLIITGNLSKPRRLQGAFLGDEEIKDVVRYLKDSLEMPVEYDEQIVEKQKLNANGFIADDEDDDELLEEAKEEIARAGKASASLLQRRLRVGYARAARILDILEEKGVIGPAQGAKPREILMDTQSKEHDEE